MEKIIKFGIFAWATIMLASCSMFGGKEDLTGTEAQLIGKWQNEKDKGWYRVFYADAVVNDSISAYEGYKWGKEWNESEDVYESDLTEHGNGWFMWRKNSAELFEIEFMEYDFARIPQQNTITLLNDTRLEYKEQDGRARQFNKVK